MNRAPDLSESATGNSSLQVNALDLIDPSEGARKKQQFSNKRKGTRCC